MERERDILIIKIYENKKRKKEGKKGLGLKIKSPHNYTFRK
jgi:hypothetical protein